MLLRHFPLFLILWLQWRTGSTVPRYDPTISNDFEETYSDCALVLQRSDPHKGTSQAPPYGGFFELFKRRVDYQHGAHEVCISYDDVNRAVKTARRRIGYRHPKNVDNTLEPTPAEVEQVAFLVIEITRILAKQFQLSNDEILNGLPLIDTSHTALWEVCPAYVKPIPCTVERFRAITGHCNNMQHSNWGAQNTAFVRFLPPLYGDGIQSPRVSVVDGSPLPTPRRVTTLVHRDIDRSSSDLTILFMSWSQFVDHDLTLAAPTRDERGNDFECCGVARSQQNPNCLPLAIPHDDPFFAQYGQRCMEFKRVRAGLRPNCALGPRVHVNMLTASIDANFIYGSNDVRLRALRTFTGGQMRTWDRFKEFGLKPLLPPITDNPDRDCIGRPRRLFCFLAGDDRANLQIHLAILHTLYVRDHNRIAEELGHLNPHWDDEKIFQETRHIQAAITQHITYNEFLPLLLGDEVVRSHNLTLQKYGYWNGYDAKVHMGLSNNFQSASFRYGHTFIHQRLTRYTKYHELIESIPLRELMFQPFIIYEAGVMDEMIAGMLNSPSQEHDPFMTEEVSNHLFQQPEREFGLDLPSINIMRGREQALPGYNEFREWCGLPRAHSFHDLSRYLSNGTAFKFSQLFKHVDDVDLWSAGISEYRLPGSRIGPTFACLVARQFVNVRRGDRFWYENSGFPSAFTPEQLHEIRKITQAKIVCENADDIPTTQLWVMRLPHPIYNPRVRCKDIPSIELRYWQEDPVHGGYAFKKK